MDNLIRKLNNYEYAEIRLENKYKSSVKLADNEIEATSGKLSGISVRILLDGSWGFAASNSLGSAEGLIKKAEKLARLTKGKTKISEIKLKSTKAKAKSADPIDLSVDEKIKMIKECAKYARGKHVKNKILGVTDSYTEKTFFNSEGICIEQTECHVYFNATAIAKKGGDIQRGTERCARVDGYKKIDFDGLTETAAEKAEKLLEATAPPAGRMVAILDPEMTGVFSHEALGHASEADAVVEKESILQKKLWKKIGNKLVNIFDDPTANDFGYYAFDDEGVPAKKTNLVENGVLCGYLSSRETCDDAKVEANGHARAEYYASMPIVRMSNTFFKPGKTTKEEVFDVRDGIYLKGMKGGSVDIFSGGFMFKADEAYEIKNGELGKLYRDTAISGNILETLMNVEAVGKDFGTSPGFCGKSGQSVPVSDGGPHIRVKNVKIG